MASTPVTEPTVQSAVEHTLMPSEVTEYTDHLKGRVRCVIVTPERAFADAIAEMVILPMFDGELGVLPGRAPLIGRLGAGELRLKTGPETTRYYVEPGFVQVRGNVVTVLTARALKAEDVTGAGAEKAAADAEALPSGTAAERANKAKARDRAQGMKKVAAKNALFGVARAEIISPGSHPI
ncbi:MAG: synthase subunit epsilon [Gemmataceae bacterium]|nr:synthase subunit epsilon [Gemmataceae bacterium]